MLFKAAFIFFWGGGLHAADCVYLQACNVNFRTMREIPKQFRSIGRHKDCDQEKAFEKVCTFLNEIDDEQLTISDLVAKRGEYLNDCKSVAYENQYLKEKLLKQYADSIPMAEVKGVKNIVIFREKKLSNSS